MRVALSLLIFIGTMFAQTANGPVFVAADVHLSAKDVNDMDEVGPGGRWIFRGATMSHLIAKAYGVDQDKIVGGAKWLDVDQFDVLAKAPGNASPAEMQAMLRALLANRFQLKAHREDRPFPVYVLTVAKRGVQLKPSKSQEEGDCVHPEDGPVNRICTGVSIGHLAQMLGTFARNYFDHPVVDRTGITGRFDFTLKWTGRGMLGSSADTVSLYDYMERQLGVKVDKDTVPMPAVVVESVNETPSPNPPNVKDALPPASTDFDAAVVRLNKAADQRNNFEYNHGRLDAAGLNLETLLQVAYNLDDDMLVGAQPWMATDLFDIAAKTDPAVDFEGMRPMLRKLLTDRFHMISHSEERPVTVYGLTISKGVKLKEGDPSARGGCKLSIDKGLRTYTCENTSMAELSAKLPDVAKGYLNHEVVDLTGLTGAYNFAISWSPVRRTMGGAPAKGDAAPDAAGGAINMASEPGNGITLFQGVEKIGLKLSTQKHPMQVLVIDKIERTPDN